jgi:hypothetical protein
MRLEPSNGGHWLVARDLHQASGNLVRNNRRRAAGGKKARQRVTTEMLEPAPALKNAAEPMR